MSKLTERQAEILAFMRRYRDEYGAPPSLREIGDEHDISSTNGVTDHLKALVRKGFVRHYPGRSRGWVPVEGT